MKLSDLVVQHDRPLEITHQVHRLDRSRDKAQAAPSYRIASPEPASDLRTLVAVLPKQLEAANGLVRRRYAWRGYEVLTGDAEEEREARGARPITLLAESAGQLLGTLTVRPRSPLYAEQTYAQDIRRLRRAGHHMGEVVKLAVEEGVDWKRALDALVHGAYLVSRALHALTDIVIEVNPRHVRFYERVLGFTVLASGAVCSRVAAPSVLMLLDLEAFGERRQASLGSH